MEVLAKKWTAWTSLRLKYNLDMSKVHMPALNRMLFKELDVDGIWKPIEVYGAFMPCLPGYKPTNKLENEILKLAGFKETTTKNGAATVSLERR